MNILSEIIAKKRERVAAARAAVPIDKLCREVATPHALRTALRSDGINIIAEFKRRSPSKGTIRADANLTEIVQSYESGGAVALSVLTEEDYFDGSLADLRAAKSAVNLPVLRKDFIFDEYQVYESAAAGADAILLIAATLDDASLLHLRQLAEDELGLDALVEVHTSDEMKRATAAGATLIGVNNRNLHTFEVFIDISYSMAHDAPSDVTLVSESGLRTARDIRFLWDVGFSGFLIGETLMRADNPAEMLRQLRA